MEKLKISLPDHIHDRLSKGAEDMGIKLETFCHVILAQAAYSQQWVTRPKPMGSISEMIGPNFTDDFKDLMETVQSVLSCAVPPPPPIDLERLRKAREAFEQEHPDG